MTKFEVIKRRVLNYDEKPLLVIHDPHATSKEDIMPLVEAKFNNEHVNYQVRTSAGNEFEVLNMVKGDVDFEAISAIAIIGDDGTFQEVINGMMLREDKKKVPVAFVPTCADSDISWSLGIMGTDQALDLIVKKECIPIDTTRVLIDQENEANLPEDPVERYK